MQLLEAIRAACSLECGEECPINVTSSVRCVRQNMEEGGTEDSRHLPEYADAADIKPMNPKLSIEKFHAICDRLNPRGGVGFYHNRAHVDTRGKWKRWGVKKL